MHNNDNFADIIAKGSKSFSLASKFFPKHLRNDIHILYAWCRYCDDKIDNQILGHSNSQKEISTKEVLQNIYHRTFQNLDVSITSPENIFEHFSVLVGKYNIPHKYIRDFLMGMKSDVDGKSYHSTEDLIEYCYQVAGTVGVMITHIVGCRNREALNYAIDLGIAMQLTNIVRDIVDDFQQGRLYIPGEIMDKHNLQPQDILSPQHRKELFSIGNELLFLADQYYQSSRKGMKFLHFNARVPIAMGCEIYREIGREIYRRGDKSWNKRTKVSKLSKYLKAFKGLSLAISIEYQNFKRSIAQKSYREIPKEYEKVDLFEQAL
ncbi:phytoene/squalene synthase family protein [Candidatus Uabimicrobium amorphum]|uniref:Phytoene synthase n=1 Tax=Uabimicrobium amorphum TaxID=2596890 RepID=A0A5S9INS2_UABAM|nr:phytoene/squalene synthase family protein [Candidatus Uabimicrobium amorphum]BBM85308.1 phytoene synthase [Candidatus Uabimicrobium amorphum]